jgi:flavodoxin
MIQIVYGSGGGNTEFVCNLLAEKLITKGFNVSLLKAKVTSFDDLDVAELSIFASPTYGHGLMEKYMGKFLKSYGRSHYDMKELKFAVIGLGDKKYDEDYFIESANILEEFVKRNDGELVCESLRIGGCVYDSLESKIDEFVKNILKTLNE